MDMQAKKLPSLTCFNGTAERIRVRFPQIWPSIVTVNTQLVILKLGMDNNFMVHPRWEKLHEPYGRRYRRASSYVKRYIDQCLYAAKADGALMCPISVSIAFQQELLLPCQFMRMSV